MYILDVLDDKLLVDLHHLPSGNEPGGSIRDAMIYLGHGSFLGATDSQVCDIPSAQYYTTSNNMEYYYY